MQRLARTRVAICGNIDNDQEARGQSRAAVCNGARQEGDGCCGAGPVLQCNAQARKRDTCRGSSWKVERGYIYCERVLLELLAFTRASLRVVAAFDFCRRVRNMGGFGRDLCVARF